MHKYIFNRSKPLKFKHFINKGYALFASLGQEIVIGMLSVSTLTYAKADGVSIKVLHEGNLESKENSLGLKESNIESKEDSLGLKETAERMLDEVNVVGARAPLLRNGLVRMSTVLEQVDFRSCSQSINDLMKQVAGVDVRQRGPMGLQTDISVRGGIDEQIAILLNGVNICDPQTGHNVFDFPVSFDDIERIEVLEGPSARIYGAQSLVGAINVITKPRSESGLGVNFETGSYGYVSGGMRVNFVTDRFSNQLSANYSQSDGFSRCNAGTLNTDFDATKIFYQGQYHNEGIKVLWHAGVSDKGWGSSTFYATPSWNSDDQYEHTTKVYTSLQVEAICGLFHISPSIYYNCNMDCYQGYRGKSYIMDYNYNLSNIYGIGIVCHFDWLAGRTVFGAHERNEELFSTNLGEELQASKHISGTNRYYTLGINRTNIDFFAEHNVMFNSFTFSFGAFVAKNSWDGSSFKVYPGFDLNYRFSKRWKAYISCNSSFRLPSFTEMYYKLNGYSANPYLKPEELEAVEGGIQYVWNGIKVLTSFYFHHGKNIIDWVMDMNLGQDAIWESINHTSLNTIGLEISSAFDFQKIFPSQHIFQRLSFGYSYINQDKDLEENLISQYALEYLRNKITASLSLNIWKDLGLRIDFRYMDRHGEYQDFSNNIISYKPYSLIDARLDWAKSMYDIYVSANNICNINYKDYCNVKQPGIWIIVGSSFKFDFKRKNR